MVGEETGADLFSAFDKAKMGARAGSRLTCMLQELTHLL
jgi:hypothetical protein